MYGSRHIGLLTIAYLTCCCHSALADSAESRQTLSTPTPLEFQQTPLSQVASHLTNEHGLNVAVAGVARDAPISGVVKRMSLGSALRFLLQQHGMDCLLEDDVVVITPMDWPRSMSTRVYPIADILRPTNDPHSLNEAIVEACHPDSWEAVGGVGAMMYARERFVVHQSSAVHDSVARVLEHLREESAAVPDVFASLDRPMAIGIDKTPLRDLPTLIAREHDVEIVLDVKSLKEAGVALDVAISAKLKAVPLGSALNLLLPGKMTYTVTDETIVLTSKEAMRTRSLPVVVYSVGDPSLLLEAVHKCVKDSTWQGMGGRGVARFYQDKLIVCQFPYEQRRIAKFLSEVKYGPKALASAVARPLPMAVDVVSPDEELVDVREFHVGVIRKGMDNAKVALLTEQDLISLVKSIEPESWSERGGKAELKLQGDWLIVRGQTKRRMHEINVALENLKLMLTHDRVSNAAATRAALARRIECDFDQAPLVDIAGELTDILGVAVHLGDKVPNATIVTLKLQHVEVETLLNVLSHQCDLEWVAVEGGIEISLEASNRWLVGKYPVANIVGPNLAPQDLADVVMTTILPDSWSCVGGRGAVVFTGDSFLVSQEASVHREISKLLTELAKPLPNAE